MKDAAGQTETQMDDLLQAEEEVLGSREAKAATAP
jgi:hypothetical protein